MKCDCLNWCGDDSRVADGKVRACAHWKAERARAHELVRVQQIATALADSALANGTVLVSSTDMDDIRNLIEGRPTSGSPVMPAR
ncbi:hypothetical protein [Thiobacillus sp. 65-1402]|uniref:hypothetical protein n=1 Tax=Thiobacillus sp. 65-1402 TaxID=1895861 RepID=UPI000963599A|nr:hypothetical protein [Thiobacillus sp. 65-1402]OJW77987.1 MAG: hypothetical protein BGO62_10470 [Thiobacillus sp. 65-1402]